MSLSQSNILLFFNNLEQDLKFFTSCFRADINGQLQLKINTPKTGVVKHNIHQKNVTGTSIVNINKLFEYAYGRASTIAENIICKHNHSCKLQTKELRKEVLSILSNLAVHKKIGVGINCVTIAEIARLNFEFKDKNYATNILSFNNNYFDHDLNCYYLGDVVLSLEIIKNNFKSDTLSWTQHLCHLLLHGFLHLLGFDHKNAVEASIQEELETQILDYFLIPNPY